MYKGKEIRCYRIRAQRGEGEGGVAHAHCMLLANGNDCGLVGGSDTDTLSDRVTSRS